MYAATSSQSLRQMRDNDCLSSVSDVGQKWVRLTQNGTNLGSFCIYTQNVFRGYLEPGSQTNLTQKKILFQYILAL